MGAFYLYHRTESVNTEAVRKIIEKNGFQAPRVFQLENYSLLLYRKQLIETDNYVLDGDSAVFCTGTPVYRGLSYQPTLKAALSDFMRGALDLKQFLGNYCLIFFHDKRISILIDELTVQHIFIDKNLKRVSSSFLAILSSFDQKLNLNKPAFYEKVTTGYVVGPDTLVAEISVVTPSLTKLLLSDDIRFIENNPNDEQVDFHHKGINQSVDSQIQMLDEYFRDISGLSADYKPEIGLSGGYDSRLLYALSQTLPVKISTYTHATNGVHEREVEIVKQLIKNRDSQLTIVPTKPAYRHIGTELEDLLKDCMYFFDGRSGYDMSTFSPVYTRSYRLKVMGENRLNVNGSGGEIYRNYSHTGLKRIDWHAWMKAHVYYTNIQNALPRDGLMRDVHQFVTGKISSRLEIDFNKKVDHLAICRYFAEIRMPDSKSIYANAQNQLSFYLTPFIEKRIILMAYRAIPYIGMTGSYEAKMIAKIDPGLAAADSIYGFPLNAEPFTSKIFYGMKGLIPDNLNNFRYFLLRKYRNYGMVNQNRYKEMVSNCDYMRKIDELLNTCFPEIRWSELVRDSLALAMVTNVGAFLNEFACNLNL